MATTIFLPGMGYTVEEAMDWPGLRQPKDEDIAEAKRLLALRRPTQSAQPPVSGLPGA